MNYHTLHYFNLKGDLKELYFSISLRTFAKTLINVFVPIYLWQIGYSYSTILWFFAIFSGSHALATFPAGKLASKYGLKHLILFSVPFLIIYYLALYSIQQLTTLGVPLLVIPLFGGSSDALFWLGHHTRFAQCSHRGRTGKELGIVKILVSTFTAIGPIIGGFLLTWYGFNFLFLIVSTLLFVAVIPLLKTKDTFTPFKFSIKRFRSIFKIRDIIGHTGFGIESSIQQVIWPIFIFFFILGEEFTVLGSITSLSLLFSLLMTYYIANKMDKHNNLFNDLGAILTGAIWIIRNFVTTGMQVFAIDSFAGLSRTTQNISFNKICYDKANKTDTMNYILIREFNINLAHACTYIFLTLFAGYFSLAFLIGAIGSFMFLFYRA